MNLSTIAIAAGLPATATEAEVLAHLRAPKKSAQHTSDTPEHGSPPSFVSIAHNTYGLPDVDPASSPKWNGLVRARRIITAEENGLRTPWFPGAPSPLELRTNPVEHVGTGFTVYLNPPGERTGELVAEFWFAITEYYRLRWIRAGVWAGFNIEQVARLQRTGATTHPLREVTLVPAEREGYRVTPTKIAGQPPHASFLTLLSRHADTRRRFAAFAAELGHVVNGDAY